MTIFTPVLAPIMGLGGGELFAVFAIIVLLFGSTKLPALARGLGQSMKEFKKAQQDDPADEAAKATEKKAADASKLHGSN